MIVIDSRALELSLDLIVPTEPKVRGCKIRRIHIHLKFLFIEFVSVNNHHGVFMRLDTLTENILTERRLG